MPQKTSTAKFIITPELIKFLRKHHPDCFADSSRASDEDLSVAANKDPIEARKLLWTLWYQTKIDIQRKLSEARTVDEKVSAILARCEEAVKITDPELRHKEYGSILHDIRFERRDTGYDIAFVDAIIHILIKK